MNPSMLYNMCNDIVAKSAMSLLDESLTPKPPESVSEFDDFIDEVEDSVADTGTAGAPSAISAFDDFIEDDEAVTAGAGAGTVSQPADIGLANYEIDVASSSDSGNGSTGTLRGLLLQYFTEEMLEQRSTLLETWNSYFKKYQCTSEDEALTFFIRFRYGVYLGSETFTTYKDAITPELLQPLAGFGRELTSSDLESICSYRSSWDTLDVAGSNEFYFLLNLIKKYSLTEEHTPQIVTLFRENKISEDELGLYANNADKMTNYLQLKSADLYNSELLTEDFTTSTSDVARDAITFHLAGLSTELLRVLAENPRYDECKDLLVELAQSGKLQNEEILVRYAHSAYLYSILLSMKNDCYCLPFIEKYFNEAELPGYFCQEYQNGHLLLSNAEDFDYDFYLARLLFSAKDLGISSTSLLTVIQNCVENERYYAIAALVDARCSMLLTEPMFLQFIALMMHKRTEELVFSALATGNALLSFNQFWFRQLAAFDENKVPRSIGRLMIIFMKDGSSITSSLDLLFTETQFVCELFSSETFTALPLHNGHGMVFVSPEYKGQVNLDRNPCFGTTSLETWICHSGDNFLSLFPGVDCVFRANLLCCVEQAKKSNIRVTSKISDLFECSDSIYAKFDYLLGFILNKCPELLCILGSDDLIELLNRLRCVPFNTNVFKVLYLLLYSVGKECAPQHFEYVANQFSTITTDNYSIVVSIPVWNLHDSETTLSVIFDNWASLINNVRHCNKLSLFVEKRQIKVKIQ